MLLRKGTSDFFSSSDFLQSAPGKSLTEKPLSFIDVGARGGAHDIVFPLSKLTSVIGFEPDVAECDRMNDENQRKRIWAEMKMFPYALADKECMHTLHMLTSNTNDSLLPPNQSFTKRYAMDKWHIVGTQSLKTTTLDQVLAQHNLMRHGEFIKLDTQGTEYEILQGATSALKKNTVAVMTEVSFCELYAGQKLFSEVEMLMRQHGFSFYGFGMMHRRSRKQLDKKKHVTAERLIYADAVFFKDPFDENDKLSELSLRSIHVLFVSALLLGYFDYALELAEKTWLSTGTEEERERIYRLVKKMATQPQEEAIEEVNVLYEKLKQEPGNANIELGRLVDSRRSYCDYDDVFNVSPLPECYTE